MLIIVPDKEGARAKGCTLLEIGLECADRIFVFEGLQLYWQFRRSAVSARRGSSRRTVNHIHRIISLPIAALALSLSSASQAQVPTELDTAIALETTGSGVGPLGVTARPDSLAAEEDGLRKARHRWLFRTSFFTAHFHPSPEHNNTQRLINFEYRRPDDWLFGAAEFRNSFGQPTELVYVGKRWNPLSGFPRMHFKLIGGVVHGYKPPHEQKIPFNSLGTAPALMPVLGYSYERFNTEVIFFGTAGMMWTIGYFID